LGEKKRSAAIKGLPANAKDIHGELLLGGKLGGWKGNRKKAFVKSSGGGGGEGGGGGTGRGGVEEEGE